MKRLLFALIVLFILIGGAFFWLLSESSDSNMPTDVTVIDLPDTFEK